MSAARGSACDTRRHQSRRAAGSRVRILDYVSYREEEGGVRVRRVPQPGALLLSLCLDEGGSYAIA